MKSSNFLMKNVNVIEGEIKGGMARDSLRGSGYFMPFISRYFPKF